MTHVPCWPRCGDPTFSPSGNEKVLFPAYPAPLRRQRPGSQCIPATTIFPTGYTKAWHITNGETNAVRHRDGHDPTFRPQGRRKVRCVGDEHLSGGEISPWCWPVPPAADLGAWCLNIWPVRCMVPLFVAISHFPVKACNVLHRWWRLSSPATAKTRRRRCPPPGTPPLESVPARDLAVVAPCASWGATCRVL